MAATLRKDALSQSVHDREVSARVISGRGPARVASVAKSAHDWEGSVCATTPLSNSAGSGNPQLESVDVPSSAETEVRAQGEKETLSRAFDDIELHSAFARLDPS